MKRKLFSVLPLLMIISALFLAACSQEKEESGQEKESNTKAETRTYASEEGDIEIPANPERVAVMAATYPGNFLELGVTPVAITDWSAKSKFLGDKLKDAKVVAPDDYETLIGLEPDLIITYTGDENMAKYKEIAPTVGLSYEKYNYLDQHLEIGKILGKEEEAQKWVDEWNAKAEEAKKKVQEAIGTDATATVVETFGKDTYVYGKNWGRGTEVIYQALGMKAPEKVEAEAFGPGYKAISAEAIPEYAGDYIFVGEGANVSSSTFMETDLWKNIPAVKAGNVITFDSDSFYFNDPISVEKELDFIVDALTKKAAQ
ncbi:iron-hydroxamate ABC transporter substrate-binding protein [Domibacillus sp. 8LH]|uniref:iron-hydroxamate ABC transporter substrate-binding protein n=1 Tax=unclassified Domibacillus TaxID=2632383 RepID=UPI00281264A4|nr:MULTISPECIES: iron-hydroxamate ABC transporter substrate-binding protein [unclassified Domibacillus]WNS81683.1 iron-hydroxamate ABC transporter substrate-binding protein [Domibacillus sp. DTU_2020_1001157_1_SI_ALB_TIR_016]